MGEVRGRRAPGFRTSAALAAFILGASLAVMPGVAVAAPTQAASAARAVGVSFKPMAVAAPAAGPSEINGLVWLDADADGVNDAAEGGLAGVTVNLRQGSTQIATTTTNSSGIYSFGSVAPGGPWVVEVLAPSLHTITVGGADNDVVRSGAANVGRSASIASLGTSVDAAVRPQWEVQLGTWGGGPLSGSAPFQTMPASTCPASPAPGDDCSASDDVVRASDTVSFLWSVSASNPEAALTGPLADVVIEQTIVPAPGANIAPGALPSACLAASGGGTPPPTSRVTQNPDGSITFVCNLGSWTSSGTAKLIQFDVDVESSENGSTFTSSAVAYSTAGEVTGGNGTTPPAHTPNAVGSPVLDDEFTISAAFNYDLNKALYETAVVRYLDPDGAGPLPTLRGRQFQYVFAISSPTTANEPLVQPLSIVDELMITTGTQTTPFSGGALEHYVVTGSCIPNNGPSAAVPMGSPFSNPARGVVSSGTCTPSRTGTAEDPYTFTLNGIDDSGTRYPTQYANGTGNLSAGPYFIASYKVAYFIPDRALDELNGVIGDSTGAGWVGNRIADFDPVSTSGQENYDGAGEPGYCDASHNIYASSPLNTGCANMPGGASSNNVVPGTPISIGPPSYSFGRSKFFYQPRAGQAWAGGFGRSTDFLIGDPTPGHGGNGIQAPGDLSISRVATTFGGEVGARNIAVCDAFDNTVQTLAPASANYSGAPAGTYVWLNALNPPGSYLGAANSDWVYEFGAFPRNSDDPLYNASRVGQSGVVDSSFYAGTDTYSTSTGRFEGNWAQQVADVNSCATATPPGGWSTDPTAVPGGIGAVNVVRIRPTDPTAEYGNTQSTTAAALHFTFLLEARDTFNGGPHAGQQIPDSTVMANFMFATATRFDTGAVTDLPSTYGPSPETIDQTGDRITLTRATLALKKNTISVDGYGSGASGVDVTGAANAGDTLVWQIQPTAAAESPTYPLTGLKVVDVLPSSAIYDSVCTAAITGGTIPDLVELNTPATGQTRLTWNLPDQTAGDPMPVLRLCTATDATVAAGTNVVNSATVSADGIPTVAAATDTHTVVLSQPGQIALQKYVDASLDELNDDQQYRIVVKNLSTVVAMDAMKVIEVFPYNSDATNSANVNRTPGSDYHGTLELTGPVAAVFNEDAATTKPPVLGTMYYTADDPSTVHQDWNQNTSRWCTYSAGTFTGATGSGPCPASLADVTAIKFEATSSLLPDAQASGARDSMELRFTLQADGNSAGDLYADRFTASTPTILASNDPGAPLQVLQSNRVQVEVFQFAVGDLVFVDINNDGNYDPGTDLLATDGVSVELWNAGPDGAVGGGDDTLVDTTTTASGLYLFTGVNQGDYYVRIPASEFAASGLLAPWAPSTIVGAEDENDDVSQDASASTGGIVTTVHTLSYTMIGGLPAGDEPLGDNTHGVELPAGLGDGFTNLTIDLAVVQTASLGDYVWYDVNGDGVQDAAEPGIPNVTVTVVWLGPDGVLGGGDDVTYTTTTDTNGAYLVENLPGGQYVVTTSNVDADFVPSYDLDGIATPNTTTVTLPAGGERLDVDFGYTASFELGNLVWNDVDNDGIYTAGTDTLVPDGVTVELYNGAGTLVGTTTTTGGVYGFDNLPAGSYYIVIPADEFADGRLLEGWVVAPNGAPNPNNDEDDSDDHNGYPLTAGQPGAGARTAIITLSAQLDTITGAFSGDEPDGFTNPTLDVALLAPSAVALQKTVVDPTPAAPGRVTEFDVELTCVLPGATTPTVYEATLNIDGTVVIIDGIPIGSVCSVSEVDSNGATPTIEPDGDFTVAVGDVVQVTITNTYEAELTAVNLRKVVVDPTPTAPGRATEFPVTLSCVAPGETIADDYPVVLDIDGSVETVGSIPIGSVCTVTETDTDGADVTIDPAGPFVAESTGVSIVVTNTYDAVLGSLSLEKIIVDPSPGDEHGDAASFPVTVECTINEETSTYQVDLPRDGSPVVIGGLLVGSTCVITETDTDGGVVTYDPGTVTISDDTTVTATVTNTFPTAPPAPPVPPALALTGFVAAGTTVWLAVSLVGGGVFMLVWFGILRRRNSTRTV